MQLWLRCPGLCEAVRATGPGSLATEPDSGRFVTDRETEAPAGALTEIPQLVSEPERSAR